MDDVKVDGPFLRSAFNYDRDYASDVSGLMCDPEEGVTQQQFKEDCDINVIVERFGLTGQIPEDYRAPVSGDFTGVTDFQSAMNAVRAAEESFMELPAHIRARFANDPQKLLEFLDDGGNRAEALKLGIIQPPPEKTRDAVAAIDDLSKVLTTPK